jgi:ketosteroid isomerase-like protein
MHDHLPVIVLLLGLGAVARMTDDRQIVEALDVEYQTAVMHGDVATMDRILADDFVLVTGRGRVYTKQELLAEARAGTVIQRHVREDRR